jgi:RimJ/RimL family protein N-acetyltransferase
MRADTMSAPPLTILEVSAEEEAAIRAAVRGVTDAALGPGRRIATPADTAALTALLADPAVSGPIYDIPRPIDAPTIGAWIDRSLAEQAAGEGLLLLTLGPDGEVAGYSKITVWPDRSAAELAGAVAANRQGSGGGGAGAARMFGWMFEALGVRMIGLTAALDNVRSAKLIDASGFVRMGERDSLRADGTVRRSLYWEMTRQDWRVRWG